MTRFEKARPVRLGNDPEKYHKWLSHELAKDPSILGLGPLSVVRADDRPLLSEPLRFLLVNAETNTRFEIGIQLGAADESLLLRTIEFREVEKSRFPTFEHVAVIVAEEVTAPLLNEISRLDESIPTVAIQVGAWEVGNVTTLTATRVLDLPLRVPPASVRSPGDTWIARSTPATTQSNAWDSVIYGDGVFVAVAFSGTNQVMTSPDGVTWTARAAPKDNWWQSVTHGNGLFVAVASKGWCRVMTSPNGVVWTARRVPEANKWSSVTYGNGLFVAVASEGLNRVMTSPDGVTWTPRPVPEANEWSSVTYGNGLFVAVADDEWSRVMTSPDGVTWTARRIPEANEWESVTYGNGLFVAVASDGTNRVMTSLDAKAWSVRLAASAETWESVTYGDGMFVAVAMFQQNRVMTSQDGVTWTAGTVPEENVWRSVTFGNGRFVAVASGGDHPVMTSGELWTGPRAPTNVSAKARDGGAVVSWTPPVNDGGTPVTGYTATASPGGATCSKFRAHSCMVGGLANGTAYTFIVTATNAAGTSIASASSEPVTPKRRPIPPPGT